MTLQQLEYVVALDNHRHFEHAAQACRVTQPTITMQVKKLEFEIGITLFDRSKQPLTPTPAGQKFIDRARQIIMEVNQLKAIMIDETENVEGTFKIGIIPTIAPYLIPKFVPEFSSTHKRTNLVFEELKTTDIIEGLVMDTLDVGILVTPLEETDIREIPMYYEPFLVYAHENHEFLAQDRVESAALADRHDVWLLNQGHCFRQQMLGLCHSPESMKDKSIQFESGSIESLKSMVDTFGGYTLVPELACNSRGKQVRRFIDPQPVREVSLVVNKAFTKERLVEELKSSIQRAVPSSFVKGKSFKRINWI